MRGKHTEWNSHVFKVELVGFGGTHPLPLTEILLPLPHFSYILVYNVLLVFKEALDQ